LDVMERKNNQVVRPSKEEKWGRIPEFTVGEIEMRS